MTGAITATSEKILPFDEAAPVFERLRGEGRTIVQCHGTFDLVHPGHIYHLEEAASLGDILVVTVTGEKHVNKGPGRPYFNDELRAKSLAAIACVDYVVIIPRVAAVEAIECVKPDIYCKGSEYSDVSTDVTGNIHDDIATVERHGGSVRYVGSVVFSSTKLLNNHLNRLPGPLRDYCRRLADDYTPDGFRDAVDAFKDLRVVLIGDIIFDRYSYVKVQGLTSKATIVSARHLYEETQTGGVLAVYRHLKQFTPHVRLISLLGGEEWARNEVRNLVEEADNAVISSDKFTSVVKHRYVSPHEDGKELLKYFSVNFIDNGPTDESLVSSLCGSAMKEIRDADIVIVADFGHGVLHGEVRDLIQDKASFVSVNCQTNSNNHGFNIINRQYRRMNCFSMDQTEILLATGQRRIDFLRELEALKSGFNAEYAWLTRGSVETIGLRTGEEHCVCVPFEAEVTDTVGAGDAFFSLASLAAAKRGSARLTTFLGQLAGSQAVKIVGNTRSISKASILKSGMALLNF